MNNKKEVMFLFLSALIFILIGILSYGMIFHVVAPFLYGKNGFDKGALATMMGWSVTLFIGYAGYLLIDKWKDQENRKLIREEIVLSAKKTFQIMQKMLLFSRIEKAMAEQSDIDPLQNLFHEVYSSLNLIKILTNDNDIKEIQDTIQKQGEFKHEVRQFQKPYDNQQAEQISLMV